jgi:hypothetical protein
METLETKKDKYLLPFFECVKCQYTTVTKCNYLRHILTSKHINTTNLSNWKPKKDKKDKKDKYTYNHICKKCNNTYKNRSGLWKHIQSLHTDEVYDVKTIVDTLNNDIELKKFLIEQNQQLMDQLSQQNKQIIELSSKTSITNNTTNNTTNNNFNLQFFLNETCKDALNITDFVNQLQVGIKDLEATGRLGYVEGISKIFINGLKQLDINQRPVHCSDSKRETMYIKDENQWTKDDIENIVLTNAIRSVAHKNIQQIPVWTEEHPEHKDLSSKYNDKYMKLVSEAMPGSTKEESDKNYKKIVKNIMKESVIEK